MNDHPSSARSTSRRRVSRVFGALAVVALLSAGVIAGLLLQQRAEAIAAGEKIGSAFAQLADEQTSRTLQIIEQTLQVAEDRLSISITAGTANEDTIRATFRELLQNRPFLRAIWVLDERGRMVYDSDIGSVGFDFSDQQYFNRQRDQPGLGFDVGAPSQSRPTGEWSLPATRRLERADGTFLGVVVAALQPLFFNRIWTRGSAPDSVVALFRTDGVLLIRSPLDYAIMGTSFAGGPVFQRLQAGRDVGTLQLVTPRDGQPRLVAYRRLGAYPNFVVVAAQTTAQVLAGWWRVVWIAVIGWAGLMAAAAGLLALLSREWNTRLATEGRYRKLFEAVPYPMALLERDTRRFLEVNDATVAQYGWSRQELLTMSSNDFYAPEDLEKVMTMRRQTTGTSLIPVVRHRRKNGTIVEIESYVHPLEIDDHPVLLATALDVTERVRMERERKVATERLREAEERSRLLFEASPYPMYAIDRETQCFSAVNNAAVAQYGWSRAEFLTMAIDDIYLPEDVSSMNALRQQVGNTLAREDASARTRLVEGLRHRIRDGAVIDVELHLRQIELNGRPANLVMARNVTDQMRAERARLAAELQASEVQARYRLLFESNPYPLIVTDRETLRLLAVNAAVSALYGWSREELLTMTIDDFYLPQDRAAMAARRQEFSADETQTVRGVRHRRKDKTLIDAEMAVRVIDYDGRPAALAIVVDVTDRIRAEQARQTAEDLAYQSQERYRLLFESNPYAVVVTDVETLRPVAVNGAAITLYGWSRDEMLAMTIDELYLPEDRAAISGRRKSFSAEATLALPGLRHRRKDGALIEVDLAVRLIDFDGRIASMAIVMDVTARNRAERARQAAEEQLRQSQKMEAVGQLTGGVAHDFNNILMVIMANAETLQEEESIDATVAARLEEISQAVLRAADLTRQLLAFSRKQALRPQQTDIADLVAATGKLLGRALGAQIEIDSVLADDLWPVDIDRAQLETALVNLCVNARDAMPDGGKLLIETRNVMLDEGYVARHPDVTAGDYVMLAVTDTGSGMPPEVVTKVFEPFYTTKSIGKGTGLGLSMVYGFIRQSNGHISIESEVGRGTIFRLYLPRGEASQKGAAVAQKVQIVGGSERILVVEDEPQVRASVVSQVRSLGYAVSEAADGVAGLASLEAASSSFDLLLTDVVMPGRLNGKALADETARRWPTTKIVFMSGYTDNVLTKDGNLEASVRLLSKPFGKADLARAIRQALDRGEAGPTAAAHRVSGPGS